MTRLSSLMIAVVLFGCAPALDRGRPLPPGDPLPGQIVVDPENPAWLKYHEAGPFFLCGPGDPEDFLYRGERNPDGTRTGDQDELIAKLAGSGANGIYFQAVRSHGGDGEDDHNPFVDSDPSLGLDDAILDQWEEWFTALGDAGVTVAFFIYDDSARIWNTGDRVGEQERAFLTALVDRFEHHPLLIWVVAEEYEERYSPARVSEIARTIRAADDHDHVIAVHKLIGVEFDEFADDPHIEQFAMQYSGGPREVHDGVVEAWRRAGGRYNLNMSEIAGHGTGDVARLKNWAAAMGGAYVMVLLMDIAGTAPEDLEDCGRLAEFMESTTFHRMEPADRLALGDTEYVLANPGDAYIAYAAAASGGLGLRGLDPGAYELRWFDPRDGDVVEAEVDVVDTDSVWAIPEGIGPEVALYVRRVR